jgi:hypothetical protein
MSNARDLADLADDATTVPTAAATEPSQPNLIINGGMTVSQRGTSFAAPANSEYTLDRWIYALDGSATGVVTVTQDATGIFAAWGSDYALKVDVTTADASMAAADLYAVSQVIEAQDLQHLEYGTAGAQDVTLSFLYQSPKSGTHTGALRQDDTSRVYAFEFTVTSANTPEKFEVTIPGDASGVINNDTGQGLYVDFPLALGSSRYATAGSWGAGQLWGGSNQQNLMDNTANNIYIGQVKLEVGSSATSFEHESYGDTLLKCCRYFWRYKPGIASSRYAVAVALATTDCRGVLNYPVEMRATPTGSVSAAGDFNCWGSAGALKAVTTFNFSQANKQVVGLSPNVASGLVADGMTALVDDGGNNSYIDMTAEL